MIAELGHLTRFDTPRQLMSYLGLSVIVALDTGSHISPSAAGARLEVRFVPNGRPAQHA